MAKFYGLTSDGEKANVQRGDLPRFFPSDLLPFENNYRFGTNDTDPQVRANREAEIEEMVADLLQNGQKQPIIVHPVSGSRFKVHAGDTRHQAFLRIEQRELPWKWGRPEDNGRPRIECRVEENGDAKRTFGTSVTENLSRNSLTCIDISNAVMIAIDQHKYTDQEILRDFKQLTPEGKVKDPAWLPNMRRLARLPVQIKRQIHLKHMAPSVGYILAEIPEESHAEVLAEAAGEAPASSDGSCYMVPEDAPSIRSVRDWQDTAVENGLTGFGPNPLESNVSIETTAPMEPTLDYSESQAPPKKTSTAKPKKVTARAVASAAKKRGLLKHKKVAHTVAGMKAFWSPLATERADSLIAQLAQANVAWIENGEGYDDTFYKVVLGILRGARVAK